MSPSSLLKLPLVVIQKLCYHGNLTSHFSSLLCCVELHCGTGLGDEFWSSFLRILLSRWQVQLFGSLRCNISGSKGTSGLVVLFFHTECSYQKFAFHLLKSIFDTGFRLSRRVSITARVNGKHDSGTKFTPADFYLAIAQTMNRPVCPCNR